MRGGVSYNGYRKVRKEAVFPTCVGVFLTAPTYRLPQVSLPHVRGGVSHYETLLSKGYKSSPRAWGCFHSVDFLRRDLRVFPTRVGVFLQN